MTEGQPGLLWSNTTHNVQCVECGIHDVVAQETAAARTTGTLFDGAVIELLSRGWVRRINESDALERSRTWVCAECFAEKAPVKVSA